MKHQEHQETKNTIPKLLHWILFVNTWLLSYWSLLKRIFMVLQKPSTEVRKIARCFRSPQLRRSTKWHKRLPWWSPSQVGTTHDFLGYKMMISNRISPLFQAPCSCFQVRFRGGGPKNSGACQNLLMTEIWHQLSQVVFLYVFSHVSKGSIHLSSTGIRYISTVIAEIPLSQRMVSDRYPQSPNTSHGLIAGNNTKPRISSYTHSL